MYAKNAIRVKEKKGSSETYGLGKTRVVTEMIRKNFKQKKS